MDVPYQETGRVQQKARTWKALTSAVRTLLATGVTPTVEEAAEEAKVSRTTAYRYFPSQQALLLAAYPEIGQVSILPGNAPTDVGERLDIVLAEMARQVTDNELVLRAMLKLSLGPPAERGELPLRRGRRRTWVADALAPLAGQMAAADFDRLTLAITVATGIEALVWLTDIAGLSRDEALKLMRFSAETLLASVTSTSPQKSHQTDRRQ
jgi:AcrR family transcriptional regulator